MSIDFGTVGNISVTMEGPFGSVGTAMRLAELQLPASDWKGAVSPFSQQVSLAGISVRSKVDLLPGCDQLEAFRSRELAFTTENVDGVLTVYAIGDRPDTDLTFQVSIMEVTV